MTPNNNRIILICTLLFFSFISTASAQLPIIKTLEKRLAEHPRTDTARVNLLTRLGYEIYSTDSKKAKEYAQEAYEAAIKLNYPEGEAASLWITGLTMRSAPKEALGYFEKALNIAERAKDQVGICNYLLAISSTQKVMGNSKASDEAIEKGEKLLEQAK